MKGQCSGTGKSVQRITKMRRGNPTLYGRCPNCRRIIAVSYITNELYAHKPDPKDSFIRKTDRAFELKMGDRLP